MRQPPKLREFPRYPVIAGFALLAIGVTIASWANIDVSPLFETAMIRRGEVWRLVSSIFPHAGILHLAFNIYWFWVFGTLVEQVYGHFKTTALVLLFAAIPNSLEFALAQGGIGLSGVGYGLFGLLWILSKRDERFRDAIDNKTIQLFVAWFFVCIATTVLNIMPVGNIAHGAGAILGILTGLALVQPERRTVIGACITSAVLFGLWAATLGRPVVNLSANASYEECKIGYEAMLANRDQEALRWLQDGVKYRSPLKECWSNLGLVYQRLGNNAAAAAAYRRAADLGDPVAQYTLGTMYESGSADLPKDTTQALYWYRKAADQGSSWAQNNVAWAFATSSDPAIRNPAAALEYASRAVSADNGHPNAMSLDTLAEAYYANGRYGDAMKTERTAIALASPEYKDEFLKRLEKYQRALQGSTRTKATK